MLGVLSMTKSTAAFYGYAVVSFSKKLKIYCDYRISKELNITCGE